MKLKILTYNIHKAKSLFNQRDILNEIKIAILQVDPDLVFLQEVSGLTNGNHQDPLSYQTERLAEGHWPHFCYGHNAFYPKGHHGNAILSKFPLIEWENIDLTFHRFEMRGLLHAIININDEKIHLLCCHLNLLHFHRKKQYEVLKRRIKNHIPLHEKVILCGDFNDWRKQSGQYLDQLGLEELPPKASFPAPFPALALDRIYLRGLEWEEHRVLYSCPWNKLSDHNPLTVNLIGL